MSTTKEFFSDLENLLYTPSGEPQVNFTTEGGITIFTLKSSGMQYNRDEYPHDTAEKAAKKFYEMIKPMSSDLSMPELRWEFSEWGGNPRREVVISKGEGVRHNYDLDIWHDWFVEHLNRLVKG